MRRKGLFHAEIYLQQRILTATSLKCCSWLVKNKQKKTTQQIKKTWWKEREKNYSTLHILGQFSFEPCLCGKWPCAAFDILPLLQGFCDNVVCDVSGEPALNGDTNNPQLTGWKLADRHISILILVGEGITVRILVHFLRRNGPWNARFYSAFGWLSLPSRLYSFFFLEWIKFPALLFQFT